ATRALALAQADKNDPWLLNSFFPPLGHLNRRLVSTTIWPSGSSSTWALSIGRGAGPSKLIPSLVYPLPWQGHLNLFSAGFQSGVHPRCVQRAYITKSRSAFRTTHTLYCC